MTNWFKISFEVPADQMQTIFEVLNGEVRNFTSTQVAKTPHVNGKRAPHSVHRPVNGERSSTQVVMDIIERFPQGVQMTQVAELLAKESKYAANTASPVLWELSRDGKVRVDKTGPFRNGRPFTYYPLAN